MGKPMGTTEGKILKMVDSETGEVMSVMNTDLQYVRSKKQDDFMKKNSEAKEEFTTFNLEAGKFIWAYPEKIQHLIQSPDFSKANLTMVFYLATYVNGLGYLAHDNNNIKMGKADLQKALGLGINAFPKFIKKLTQHEILIELTIDSKKVYKWNEEFNFYGSAKGIAKPTMLVRTYVNQVRELYEATDVNGKRKYSATILYPIFALVPYLHRTSNIICKNPDVKDINEIEYFTLSEIAELLDLTSSKKMSTALSSILLDGQTTFRKVESKNEKYLQMNPRVFWRGVVAPDARLVSEFNMINYNRMKRSKISK
ncbi:hypothetical protein ACFPYN_11915 [Paenisporosarcina macmurdoensis]|uniref:Plasmid replication protein RepL domain-containing protein n=1 Tax=Paenisporosarcina macmurdoensis TaxID=212659 RepID=A0ABW1LAA9_9BACL